MLWSPRHVRFITPGTEPAVRVAGRDHRVDGHPHRRERAARVSMASGWLGPSGRHERQPFHYQRRAVGSGDLFSAGQQSCGLRDLAGSQSAGGHPARPATGGSPGRGHAAALHLGWPQQYPVSGGNVGRRPALDVVLFVLDWAGFHRQAAGRLPVRASRHLRPVSALAQAASLLRVLFLSQLRLFGDCLTFRDRADASLKLALLGR